jgi:5-carboxymethyl-2-hydroxymuconate isomerase
MGQEFNAYSFLPNEFTEQYIAIIKANVSNPVPTETQGEDHHIVPRSLKGTNASSNIVRLSIIDHVRVHRLLAKMTHGLAKYKMSKAWSMMLGTRDEYTATDEEIAEAKILRHAALKAEWAARSEEEKKAIFDKLSATVAAKSDEERAEVRVKISAAWYAKSEEEQRKIIEKHVLLTQEQWATRSEEEKMYLFSKISETSRATWAAKSEEEMLEFRNKISVTWREKSKEEQDAFTAQRLATLAAKSDEERAETADKKRVACINTWKNKSDAERSAVGKNPEQTGKQNQMKKNQT